MQDGRSGTRIDARPAEGGGAAGQWRQSLRPSLRGPARRDLDLAAPAEAHARIAYALAEVRRFLVPVSRVNEASFLGQLPRHCLCLIPINDLSFVRDMGRQMSILKLARTRVLKLWPHGVHLDKKCTSIWKGIWNI